MRFNFIDSIKIYNNEIIIKNCFIIKIDIINFIIKTLNDKNKIELLSFRKKFNSDLNKTRNNIFQKKKKLDINIIHKFVILNIINKIKIIMFAQINIKKR